MFARVVCFWYGERSRPIYRLHVCRGQKGEANSFTWQDCRDLIVAAHNQLTAPVVWVSDNLNVHRVDEFALFFVENEEWLPVFQLPSYAPEFNPQLRLDGCDLVRPRWLSHRRGCPPSSRNTAK